MMEELPDPEMSLLNNFQDNGKYVIIWFNIN